jgi:NADH-quinone oxidoreductase subunit J
VGLKEANSGGNIQALADLLFSRYVFIFEATSALLITAAVGAMVLAHRERLAPKKTQADLAAERIRAYAETGAHLGPLPPPGVYARHNAVDTPALLPDGSPAPASVSRVLAARGTMQRAGLRDIESIKAQLGVEPSEAPETAGKSAATGSSEENAAPIGSAVQPGDVQPEEVEH